MLLGVIVIAMLALVGLSAMIINLNKQDMKKPPTNNSKVLLEGATACLPHKDTSGPQTLECAAGLKVGNVYYALTYRGNEAVKAPEGDVTVTGVFTAATGDEIYSMVGTILVDSITERK